MLLLAKIIHVLSLGLWFGTVVFFTFVVGLSLFGTFESLSEKPGAERPFWFPLPPELEKTPPSKHFPDPLRKEQGSRVAGAAVGPMFTWYYGIQLACGVLAIVTALTWLPVGPAHKARVVVLGCALIGAAVGWWMDHKVGELRRVRSETSDAVLKDPQPSPDAVRAADEARTEFGRWHGYSLIVNFLTLALVTAAMALAAQLPAAVAPSSEREAQQRTAPLAETPG